METDASLAPDQAQVTVKLAAGAELAVFIEHAAGSPEHPLTDGQLAAKFTGLAAGRLGESAAQEIREEVDRLETLADVTTLLKLCRGGPGARARDSTRRTARSRMTATIASSVLTARDHKERKED